MKKDNRKVQYVDRVIFIAIGSNPNSPRDNLFRCIKQIIAGLQTTNDIRPPACTYTLNVPVTHRFLDYPTLCGLILTKANAESKHANVEPLAQHGFSL